MRSLMRYGIFSDIHSNLEALKSVIDAYKKESIDVYLCVGDIVGYGANPLECVDKLRNIAAVCVAGNHDWASVDLFSEGNFCSDAQAAILWTRKQLDQKCRYYLASLELFYKNEDLTLVHGTLDSPQDFSYMIDSYDAENTFRLLESDICFVGHSHVVGFFTRNNEGKVDYSEDKFLKIKKKNRYIVNVGSVGQPRDGNPDSAYCVYDTDKKEVTIKRIKYNIKSAGNKIIKAGLPEFLRDRLLTGR